jgi:hypothetical protein
MKKIGVLLMGLMFCAFTVVAQDNNANASSDNTATQAAPTNSDAQDQAHKNAADQDRNAADQASVRRCWDR